MYLSLLAFIKGVTPVEVLHVHYAPAYKRNLHFTPRTDARVRQVVYIMRWAPISWKTFSVLLLSHAKGARVPTCEHFIIRIYLFITNKYPRLLQRIISTPRLKFSTSAALK